MKDTLARWSWRLWLRPMPQRDYVVTLYSFLRPHAWLRRRLADTTWDEIETDFLDLMVDPEKTAVDVGANVGKYAARLSELAPRVLAFEPDPLLAAKIARALPRNVEVHAAAVSDTAGVASLRFPVESGRANTGLATIEPGALDRSSQSSSFLVPTVRLDDFPLGPVGFIKIDVEGHELHVLQGALRLIDKDRPVILVEAEDRHKPGAVDLIRAFLEPRGFAGFFILDRVLRPIADFNSDLQLVAALDLSRRRTQMRYVNNFIFVPCERAESFARRMDDALRQRANSKAA